MTQHQRRDGGSALRAATRTALLGLAGAVSLTGSIALAQEGGEGSLGSSSLFADSNWLKICGDDERLGREVCTITARDLTTEDGRYVASAQIIEVAEQEQRVLRAIVPLRVQLPAGVRVQIDGGEQIAGRYLLCFANGCLSEAPIDINAINAMKAGANMSVTVLNQRGQTVPYQFTLTGFTAAYDGDPVDPNLIQQEQGRLQDELERRAQEARERIEQQQQQ